MKGKFLHTHSLYVPVNVELTLKGFEFGLHHISAHDMTRKGFGIMNLEGLARGLPRNDMRKALGGCVFEEGIQLARKGEKGAVVVVVVIVVAAFQRTAVANPAAGRRSNISGACDRHCFK